MPLSVFFIVLTVVFFLGSVIFLPVTLVFQGIYHERFILKLHIRFFGLKVKSLRLYPKTKPGSKKKVNHRREKWLSIFGKIETAIFIKCCVGFADAAATAKAVGILQGLFNTAVAVADNFTNLKKQQIEIEPSFNNKCFVFNGICIARLTVGNIILGILHYKK